MKSSLKPTYVVDENGKRIAVQLSIKAYQKLLDDLEELSDIAAYNEAKLEKPSYRPLEEAARSLVVGGLQNSQSRPIFRRFKNQ